MTPFTTAIKRAISSPVVFSFKIQLILIYLSEKKLKTLIQLVGGKLM